MEDVMAGKRRMNSRKTAKKSLEWQLDKASSLHMDLIGLRLRLDDIPDTHLPQAPLCRATLELISDCMRKWQERLKDDIHQQQAEEEAKKAKKRKPRGRPKKVAQPPEKTD